MSLHLPISKRSLAIIINIETGYFNLKEGLTKKYIKAIIPIFHFSNFEYHEPTNEIYLN